LPYLLVTLGLVGTLFFALQVMNVKALEPTKTFGLSALAKYDSRLRVYPSLKGSVPTYISIPAQNINAPVITVGKASDGSIQMPPVLQWTTGWYQYSPTPGQIGPSIIVGHVDNYKNISVFWRLRYLVAGNLINITRADGSTAVFKVTALQQFPQNTFPSAEVYGNIPNAGLRLITCGGTFSTATESYDQNTVVYATFVS
jgi:sortase (surface protein transpeptidase)